MSAVDASCFAVPAERDIAENGAGEMKPCKLPSSSDSSSSQTIALEILNDILENAFEVIMAKGLQPQPKVDKITPNFVGDILDNILSPPATGVAADADETVLLDDEIKQIIKEMKYPPEQRNIICMQGVGDQLEDAAGVAASKVLAEQSKRNTLERKNRLTNLMRSSKQMLSKFVANESRTELKRTRSEEMNETLLKVIDLDSEEYKYYTGKESSSVIGILKIPSESMMDMVELESTPPNTQDSTLEENAEKDIATTPEGKMDSKKISRKKKWNFGAKIMKYLRKRPTQE